MKRASKYKITTNGVVYRVEVRRLLWWVRVYDECFPSLLIARTHLFRLENADRMAGLGGKWREVE